MNTNPSSNTLTLILGGARSGKTSYAQEQARQIGGKVLYIATAAAGDEEMRMRIEAHRAARPAEWQTLEATLQVGETLISKSGQIQARVVIVDCMTLLVSNVLLSFSEDAAFEEVEQRVQAEIEALLKAHSQIGGQWFIVSNEVGLGLVPPYPLGRFYRDLLGWANQALARSAEPRDFYGGGNPDHHQVGEMLKTQNLSVFYGQREILHNVNLDVASGEVLALIGPNGAGKSTLIRAVSGVIPIASGGVRTNGDDFHSLTPMQRAKFLAVVPQAVSLPPAFTAWETVLMGRTPYLGFLGQTSTLDEQIARSALEHVHALELADRRVGELSGGEAQRVLLARALCQSTPILLLDEPTAHLDLQYQVSLLDLVCDLAHHDHLAVLIALHDLNLATRYADRVALMVAGEITAIGAPREVLTPELISQAYCLPVQVVKHPFMDVLLILPESEK